MVKKIDEKDLRTIEHVGITLWRAASAWKRAFALQMAERGFPWHGEARGEILAHLGPSGRSQAELVQAMGVSKQAVQQLLDQLEAEGVVARKADPVDRRAKRIVLTPLGLEDFAARNQVKKAIEAEYRARLGAERYAELIGMLELLGK